MTLKRTSAANYGIDVKHLCPHAVKVVRTLLEAGFKAYLVGGCVRDMLLGLAPKDFDVSTDARPEDVITLFRRARIIGRRFKIVHVRFGREVIEVTTFRGHHSEDHPHAVASPTGQLLRDNVFGSLEEDAIRRDFTVNSLYYDLESNEVLDYTFGLQDIKDRKIRVIGDPEQRYREDPVRIIRAVRFAAKLNFEIEPDSAAPLHAMADMLGHVPAARLFDEANKLLLSGYGEAVWFQLKKYHLLQQLFPLINEALQQEQLLIQALINTDLRIREAKGINPAFFYSVLLWLPLQTRITAFLGDGLDITAASVKAAQEVISAQLTVTSIPRRFTLAMREIWSMQHQLTRRSGQRAAKNIQQPRFRAAYDFLLLREQCGEDTNGLGQWWTDYQEADTEQRQKMVHALTPRSGRRNRYRSRKAHNDVSH